MQDEHGVDVHHLRAVQFVIARGRDLDRVEWMRTELQPGLLAELQRTGGIQSRRLRGVDVERKVEGRALIGADRVSADDRVPWRQRDGGATQRIERHGIDDVRDEGRRQSERVSARDGRDTSEESQHEVAHGVWTTYRDTFEWVNP